jgi:transposase
VPAQITALVAKAPVRTRGRTPLRPGHNLLNRLHQFRRDVLRFLDDFKVPFTNNLGERDLRMMKVKMKISGGFRTMAGAKTFTRLRSIVSTARKTGWNILETLPRGIRRCWRGSCVSVFPR